MSRLRIVTDSTADIPASLRKELDIEVVPLKVHFGEETYVDGVTLSSDEFYPKLAASPVTPKTSQPSPAEFLDVYKKLLQEDEDTHILSIHISSVMSGTFQSAELAKSLLDKPEKVTVFDSRSASYGIGMLAVEAARMAREGRGVEEAVERIRAIRNSGRVYFIVDTLEYLQKGGRIGKAQAVLGSLLNIKPILTIDDEGEVASVDKVRGTKKAVQRIVELYKQDYDPDREVTLDIVHSNDLPAAETVAEALRAQYNVRHLQFVTLGPVIGVHTGPGTVGVFMRYAE